MDPALRAALTLARPLATPARKPLIDRLLAYPHAAHPTVEVATPLRFVSPRKLAKPSEAIDGMLEVIDTTLALCAERGLPARLGRSGKPPLRHPPALWLSHHTIASADTAALTAQGTIVRHFKAADLPGYTIFDPQGFSGWSSLAEADIASLPLDRIPQPEADAFFATQRDRIIGGAVSKYAQGADTPLPDASFVFIALQTIGDMVQRKAFVPMLTMLDWVVDHYAGTGTHVVIKRHPKCRSATVQAALARASAQPHVTLTTGSIHAILARAEAVFTVNSGVGSEAMLHEVPIYTFGAADYAPIAHQIRTRADLPSTLAPKVPADTLHRFHHFYRKTYQTERATGLRDRLNDLINAAQSPDKEG